jgi:hypothetical protein
MFSSAEWLEVGELRLSHLPTLKPKRIGKHGDISYFVYCDQKYYKKDSEQVLVSI